MHLKISEEEATIETIGKPVPPQRRTSKGAAASALVHIIVLTAFIHRSATWVAPIRLPGAENGTRLLLTYSPGRAPVQTSTPNPQSSLKPVESVSPLPTLPKPKAAAPQNTESPASPQPNSSAGADSLGSGNINIALASYFPTPKPDLSTLPRGTRGDVILDIVIDSTGKIADVKITSSLGYGIDETVIATVQQWTFHPATKDGQPVASEQELHFHYEKA